MSTKHLKLDLHPIYNKGELIDRSLRDIMEEAEERKASKVEIVCGKGSGQLKKKVLRFLNDKSLRHKYDRIKKDSDNFGRIFIYFRWK